jgi:hypothetical protein
MFFCVLYRYLTEFDEVSVALTGLLNFFMGMVSKMKSRQMNSHEYHLAARPSSSLKTRSFPSPSYGGFSFIEMNKYSSNNLSLFFKFSTCETK